MPKRKDIKKILIIGSGPIVIGQGCDSDISDDDVKQSYGDVTVVVDPTSAQMLEGATLDYKDGLDQSGFAITNPNATRSCGCGQSFS